MKLAIYGAQGMALAACEALKSLYPQREISCFLVTHLENNRPMLDNISVRELPFFAEGLSAKEKDDYEILIATPETAQHEIEEILEDYGFRYYRRLDSRHWAEMMKLHYIRIGKFLPLAALPLGCSKVFLRIYMAKSHKDRMLRQNYRIPDYMLPIQVGTELCNMRIADCQDNIGDNISAKNGNYSELTALYWIWKNRLNGEEKAYYQSHEYYGLAQYRRMLWLDEEDMYRLLDNDVDVVLPYPMPYEPDINAHHQRYLKDSDWDALLVALQELQPEYAECFQGLLGQRYLYNYNVILAKKMVLKNYCGWLFPILERVEELSDPRGCDRCDRYIGYMGETLETLYFMKNADKLNVVHTECRFLI